jgi:hypothetical protein
MLFVYISFAFSLSAQHTHDLKALHLKHSSKHVPAAEHSPAPAPMTQTLGCCTVSLADAAMPVVKANIASRLTDMPIVRL